jgi:signal transduction histidine kinase
MSLRSKIALIVLFAVTLFEGVDRGLRRANFDGAFEDLEHGRVSREVDAIERKLDNLLSSLERQALVVGSTLTTASDLTAAVEALPGRAQVDIALLLDPSGRALARVAHDPSTREPLEIRSFPRDAIAPSHPLMQAWLANPSGPRGPLRTERGVLMLCSVVIERAGTQWLLALGQFIDEEYMRETRAEVGTRFDVILVPAGGFPDNELAAIDEATAVDGPVLIDHAGDRTRVYQGVRDLRGLACFVIRFDVERTESLLWEKLEHYELMSAVSVALFFPLVLLLLLQGVVTGPIKKLTEWAISVGRSANTKLRLEMHRTDEIGQLAEEFDRMLAEVQRARAAESTNARMAGRSEIAVSVMHNVGTLVNSVSVSADLCRDRAAQLELDDLRAIFAELVKHRGDLDTYLSSNERGQHLLPFLEAVITRLDDNTEVVRRETDCLTKGISKICALMSAMQSVEDRGATAELVGLAEQIDLALELTRSTDERFSTVRVHRSYEPIGPTLIDRHRLPEIFVNLFRNALEAMEHLPEDQRELSIRLSALNDERIRISITDVGKGIAAEDLARIFAQGFTTRVGGNGFGLHFASIAALELGGELRARSDGPGTGATFLLDLPRVSADSAGADGACDAEPITRAA